MSFPTITFKPGVDIEVTPRRALQGRSFACLPQLRDLRIEAEASSNGDGQPIDGAVTLELAGLPSGLDTLEAWVPCVSSTGF